MPIDAWHDGKLMQIMQSSSIIIIIILTRGKPLVGQN